MTHTVVKYGSQGTAYALRITISLVGLWNKKSTTNYEKLTNTWIQYLSSSLVVTNPIRLTVSIPPDTRPNIE